MSDIISKVVMKLKGLSHPYPDDHDHELRKPHPAMVALHRRRTKKAFALTVSCLSCWPVRPLSH
jgi:hypothetical protein